MDSIVEKAGISKGGFYAHYDSKDAILTEWINEYVSKLDFAYNSFLESFPDIEENTASNIILALVDKIADIVEKIGYDLIRLAYRIHIERNGVNDSLLNSGRDIYKIFSTLLQRGIQQGESLKKSFHAKWSQINLSRFCVDLFMNGA